MSALNQASQFEDEATTVGTASPAPAEAPATQTTAVAVKPAGGVAISKDNPVSSLKDAFPLDWDSLPRVLATNGSFYFKDEDTKAIGDQIVIDLVTFQDQWMVSPGDRKPEAREHLRYSKDGITATDGTDLKEHLKNLKDMGYSKASISQRLVIGGELISANKDDSRVGQLIMIDLPPTGRGSFTSYELQAAYAVSKGRKTAEEARRVTLKAVVDKTRAGEQYTKTVFSL